MKNNSIPWHKEFGLNPTIPACFICGKDRNEIALLGDNYKKEAPKNMVIDYVPCDECFKNLNLNDNVLILEAENEHISDMPRITGRYCTMNKEDWKLNFSSEITAKLAIRYCEPEFFQKIIDAINNFKR